MKITFGTLLKELRRSKNISQRELASKVGCDFTYISKIENDRLPPPAGDTIQKICAVLETPSEVLMAQAGKISNEIKDVVTNPEAIKFLQEVQQMNLSDGEWRTLHNQLKSLR